jgi:hypothetical protein
MRTLVERPAGRTLLRRATRISLLFVALQLFYPAANVCAAAAKPATKIVNVADTRKIPPGPTRWVADLYNTSYWQFGLFVVFLMAGMGVVLGYGCDRLVSLLGINLGKMQHHE